MQPVLFETAVGNEAHFPEAVMTLQDEHFQSSSFFGTKGHLMGKWVIALRRQTDGCTELGLQRDVIQKARLLELQVRSKNSICKDNQHHTPRGTFTQEIYEYL